MNSMSEEPFSSIIVPTYNQAAFISAALDSLLNQTDPSWEAIVVNDGSTDGTAALVEKYAQRDSRIKLISQANGGVAAALNTGLRHARGRWLHWLSSDDMFESNKLEVNRLWIERHPEANFFFSYFSLLRDATGELERRDLWGPLPQRDAQILTLFYRNFVNGISICVRRETWEQTGIFDSNLRYAQDYDLWLRLLQQNQGVFIPEWTVISRNHAAQGSEVFPDACYFDTAKAAIRFINRHSFSELVPFADLSQREIARDLISFALEVACDRTSFIYCLGAQPAFMLRVLEWVFPLDKAARLERQELATLAVQRIRKMALQEGGSAWEWMWCKLAFAVSGADLDFTYTPLDHIALAQSECIERKHVLAGTEDTLVAYLEKFENFFFKPDIACSGRLEKIVFQNIAEADLPFVLSLANQLRARGYRVLILANGTKPSWLWHDGIPVLRNAVVAKDAFPWLGQVDLLVHGDNVRSIWIDAIAATAMSFDVDSDTVLDRIVAILDRVKSPHGKRKVVFVQRSIWGGGAERVVWNLVRYLNRQRYAPAVVVLHGECSNSAVSYPADVSLLSLRSPAVQDSLTEHVVDMSRLSMWGRSLKLARRAYRRVSPEWRARFRLNDLVSFARRTVRGVRRSRNMLRGLHHMDQSPCDVRLDRTINPPAVFHDAMDSHLVAANRLAGELSKSPDDNRVLITVMEEATVAAWLAQVWLDQPFIASLHTFESRYFPMMYPGKERFDAEYWSFSQATRNASNVVTPGDGCGADIASYARVASHMVRTIPNPIDCARVRRLSSVEDPDAMHWEDSSEFRLVHVGRLSSEKNHGLLLQACAELQARGRLFSLACIGDGIEREHILGEVERLGLGEYVKIAGGKDNPYPWIRKADVLVLTSQLEAFALVLVEAMICGTAIVSVDCPTGPREVLAGGEFGMLTLPDPIKIADAIECLMDNPELTNKYILKGFQRAEVYDVSNVIGQWEALIDEQPGISRENYSE
jgi:glycosyltransferase involved in cell wall biosynthesis/GT2 family glycosyltransferase